jgi:CRP-like cAMP-binding protein
MSRALNSAPDKAQLLPQIRQCVLFADLDDDQVGTLLKHTRVVDLAVGETLFEQQQPARELFLLVSGQIKLARYSPDGNEKIIDLISTGNTFAEAITFARQPIYPVSASAVLPSRVLCFDSATYADMLRQSTDACFAVMAQMSRRLHWQIAEIDRLTLHSATFRVVCYLLDQVPSTQLGVPEVRLDTPKHVIAARLSITPETLSRSFSKLSREGLIEVHDNAITLSDVGKLRAYAQGESL